MHLYYISEFSKGPSNQLEFDQELDLRKLSRDLLRRCRNLSTVAILAAVAELCAVGGGKMAARGATLGMMSDNNVNSTPSKCDSWPEPTPAHTPASERMGIAAGGGGGQERQRLCSSCNLKEIGELASLLTLAAR